MKKLTKACLIISAVFFLTAVGCIIAGLAVSGNPITAAADIIENISDVMTDYDEDFDAEYRKEDFALMGEFTKEEVKALDVDMQAGQLVVKTVSGDACRVWKDTEENADYGETDIYSENETLYICDEKSDFRVSVTSVSDMVKVLRSKELKNIGEKVIIELPEQWVQNVCVNMQMGVVKFYDLSVNQWKIDVEAGCVYTDGIISGDSISTSVGFGTVVMDQLECNTAVLDVEMGDMSVKSVMAKQLTADVDLGNLILNRVEADETKADCEMGDIAIEFVGNSEDYDISSSVEMGNIDIAKHGGQRSDADKKVELTCEMGNIAVTFLKKTE